jgi:hypothetical protein
MNMGHRVRSVRLALALLGALVAGTARADLQDGLIAYWTFDECAGGTVHDASGHGNDGVMDSGAWTPGVCDCALELAASRSGVYAIPGSWDDTLAGALTVSAWVKWYGPTSRGCYIFDARDAGMGDLRYGMIFLISSETRKAGFELLCGSDPTFVTVWSNRALVPGEWTHIAAVLDFPGGVLSLYLNGELDNPLVPSIPYCRSDDRPAIGNNHWAPGDDQWAPLNGVIDDLRIYDRALSADEVRSLFDLCAGGVPVRVQSWGGIKAMYRAGR